MYYLKGFGSGVLIIERSIKHQYSIDFNIPIGPNREWVNLDNFGTQIKLSLVLDKHGDYKLSRIFKKSVELTPHSMYAEDLSIMVDELPPLEYLGRCVSIKIEKSL